MEPKILNFPEALELSSLLAKYSPDYSLSVVNFIVELMKKIGENELYQILSLAIPRNGISTLSGKEVIRVLIGFFEVNQINKFPLLSRKL